MKKYIFIIIGLFLSLALSAQNKSTPIPSQINVFSKTQKNCFINPVTHDSLCFWLDANGNVTFDVSHSGRSFTFLDTIILDDLTANQFLKLDDDKKIISVASAGDAFDGNRTVKRSGIPNINVGTTTTLSAFIEAYFFPYVAPTISINGDFLSEIGTSNLITINGATTVNDGVGFSNGTINKTSVPTGTVYTFGSATSYTTNVTFYPKQSDVQTLLDTYKTQQDVATVATTIFSSTKSCRSVYPFLYGVNAGALETGGTTIYTAITKLVQQTGNKTVSLTGTNGYIYFAYPASYGNLSSILDQNGFEQITAFTKYTANVTSVSLGENWSTSYYIYKSNNITSPAVWSYQFKY